MVFPNEVVVLPDPVLASDLVDGPTLQDKLVAQLGPYKPVVEALEAHGLTLPTRTLAKTGAYTMVAGDGTVLANAAGGTFAITLPAHVNGRMVRVEKTDATANLVTVLPGSGTINGAATDSLALRWQARTYQSDGTNWVAVASGRADGRPVLDLSCLGTPDLVDDSARIQAKLDLGFDVVFPADTTWRAHDLHPLDGQRITIEGGCVIRQKDFPLGEYHGGEAVFHILEKTGVVIEGAGTIDGQKSRYAGQATQPGTHGVKIGGGCAHVRISVKVTNFPGATAAGGAGGDGIYIGYDGEAPANVPADIEVSGCTLDGNVRQGVSVTRGTNMRIVGNLITNTSGTDPGAGVDIEPDLTNLVRDVLIADNVMVGNYRGVVVANDAERTTVRDNIIVLSAGAGANQHGILTQATSTGTGRCEVTGNLVVGGYHGISHQAGDGVIVGNHVYGAKWGLVLNAAATVTGNTIQATTEYGGIVGAISGAVITSNSFVDCGGPAHQAIEINAGAAANILMGNYVRDSRGVGAVAVQGIRFLGGQTQADGWVVLGNKVVGPATAYSPSGLIERLSERGASVAGVLTALGIASGGSGITSTVASATPGITLINTSAADGRASIRLQANRTVTHLWDFGVNTDGGNDKAFEIYDITGGNVKRVRIQSLGNLQLRGIAGVSMLEALYAEPADGATGILVRRNVGGVLSLQPVTMGAADSGGAGFKALRVPN